jgi:hypothetical protein
LLVVIAVLGAVPVLSGLLGIVIGPEALPGGGPVNATIDSEYRFTNTFWLAAGLRRQSGVSSGPGSRPCRPAGRT